MSKGFEARNPSRTIHSRHDETPLPFFQAKLKINTPGDVYEKEADAMADQVMRSESKEQSVVSMNPVSAVTPVQRKCAACEQEEELQRKEDSESAQEQTLDLMAGGNPSPPDSGDISGNQSDGGCRKVNASSLIQRSCDTCKIDAPTAAEQEEGKEESDEEGDQSISRKEDRSQMPVKPMNFESKLTSQRNSGGVMKGTTKALMEDRFNMSFDHVRIHNDTSSADMSTSIHAQAFTHGSHIYFNSGKYNPDNSEGRRLLAHELTHVVQQTGHTNSIHRKTEDKIGNWAHENIQSRLRNRDKKLITEAPIPGGTRDGTDHNSVGFADFYKAEGQIVSGIMAHQPQESKDSPETPPEYGYKNMSKGRTKGSKWSKIASGSAINYGPSILSHKHDRWSFKPNFPTHFHVGELKPLFPTEFPASLAYHGTGFMQVGNYDQGFRKFVKRVYADHPQHQKSLPSDITGHRLNIRESDIPPSINYAEFDRQYKTSDKEAILKKDSKQRVWLYRIKDGVYVYFLMPNPLEPEKAVQQLEEHRLRKNDLLAKLKHKRTPLPNTLLTKPIPGAVVKPVPVPLVQRKPEDWDKQAKDWEQTRKEWVTGKGAGAASQKPAKFLKEQAKGLLKKKKVDDKLNITTSDAGLKERIQDVSQIKFWGSFRGRLLGALRFRFAKVFDKVDALFEKIKAKFKSHHSSSTKLNERNGIFSGWKKVATRAIIRFAVEVLKQMLVDAFKGFVSCINGLIDVLLSGFHKKVEESKHEAFEEIAPVCCQLMDFHDQLKTEYEKQEKVIASFTQTIETLKQWREILNYVEMAVRVGVQIVSCGLPPGLGCLWGLVAQVGISAGLSLLARTNYFEDEIAKPAAHKIMDALVGDSLHNFMIDLLEKTPLQPYMAEAKTCHRRVRGSGSGTTIGGNTDKLNPNDPANMKAREEWEKEFKSQMLKDLQAVFDNGKGRKVTENDLKKLVEAIQQSKKTPDEVKQLIERSRQDKSGKLNLIEALAYIEKGEAPERPTANREYDQKKAMENNAKYQRMIGWSPFTFYKKPGVQVDSTEFADFIYDMQKALGMHADGMAGPDTVIRYYEKNNVKGDAVLENAQKILEREKILLILAEKYPPTSQLKADLNSVDWSAVGPGEYAIKLVDGRRLIFGRTSGDARIGGFYKVMEAEFGGKRYNKILDTTTFYNLDTVNSGDDTGAILRDLNNKKRTILPTIFLTANDTPIAVGSALEAGDAFRGLLVEEIK